MLPSQPPEQICVACGKPIPGDLDKCPECGRVRIRPRPGPPGGAGERRAAPLPPTTGRRRSERHRMEPVQPAPGQEEPGSWAYIKGIKRADKVFGALLVLMALETLGELARGRWFGALVSAIILWGVLTLRWWGYLVAMALSAMSLAIMVMLLVALSIRDPGHAAAGSLVLLLPMAIAGFVLFVLFTRREHFA